MWWMAKFVRGNPKPYVYQMRPGAEIQFGINGEVKRQQGRAWPTKTGAAAISQTPEGAVASALCVIEQLQMKAESIIERAKLDVE